MTSMEARELLIRHTYTLLQESSPLTHRPTSQLEVVSLTRSEYNQRSSTISGTAWLLLSRSMIQFVILLHLDRRYKCPAARRSGHHG